MTGLLTGACGRACTGRALEGVGNARRRPLRFPRARFASHGRAAPRRH
ncbi:hypothetical protein C7S16_6994 [Burkholderia thailandensis]|uniref:Uncharacterized protein n=1 Tax=Burkholderia thailandensis TaxID=57975 RepID=A0AAW9CKB7_BURTH|nr:hypothetical protein [Burkholderia thailandensis]MDW9251273.1 hypothetical protein [Burkholderia thailandensis]